MWKRRRGLALMAVLAAVAAGCADTPTAPSASATALSRGAAPQSGTPPPEGDSLGVVNNALGATNFLSFGDSLTFGTTSSFDGAFLFDPLDGNGYPEQLDGLLEARFTAQDFTVANFGNPGEYAFQALSSGRFQQALAARRPQGLLLLEGINDLNFGQSVSQVVGTLQQMVELARFHNATVLLGNMFQTCRSVDPNTGTVRDNSADRIEAFNSALNAMVAGRQNVYLVNLYGAFGNNCGPDGGVGLLGGDGLHPTVNGYAVMAARFRDVISSRFAVRGSFQ